jgi:hypothetical protein
MRRKTAGIAKLAEPWEKERERQKDKKSSKCKKVVENGRRYNVFSMADNRHILTL